MVRTGGHLPSHCPARSRTGTKSTRRGRRAGPRLTLSAIQEAVEARKLRVDSARAIVSIATLLPDPLARHALYAIDWVERFAVGAARRMVSGFDVAVVQRGEFWRAEAPYATAATPAVTERAIDQGEDLAVAIEGSVPIPDEVTAWVRDRALPVRRLVVIGPTSGPRDNAVAGAEEACALAVGIRDALRQHVKGHTRVHLFIAAPMALALLLGHRWNRVAPTVVYEDLAALGYEAAFSVNS